MKTWSNVGREVEKSSEKMCFASALAEGLRPSLVLHIRLNLYFFIMIFSS